MKLLINTATTCKGGGVQGALSFITECIHFPRHEYHVVLSERLESIADLTEFPDTFRFYRAGYRPSKRVFSLKSRTRFFKNLEKKIQPDVVFTTSGPAYWKPNVPHVVGYNLPHYIYPESPFFDLLPIKERLKWKGKGAVLKHYFKKEGNLYVVQTDDVGKRLKRWLGADHVETVTNTCSTSYFNPKQVPDKLPEREKNEFRVLTFSSYYLHKNLELIPEIADRLESTAGAPVRFVLTLPEENFKKIISVKFRDIILNAGPVHPDEGPALYNECDAMFLPTLLECFSASYPEAMVMGKPIITTGLGFSKGICGQAALYFEPLNATDAAKKITVLRDRPDIQQRLIREGKRQLKKFDTPLERAGKYLEICKRLASTNIQR